MIFFLFIISAYCRQYQDHPYSEITAIFKQLSKEHPDLIHLKYPLDGQSEDKTVSCGQAECEFFYAEVTDFNVSGDKPTLLLVGGFHGDERVGPNAITELADLLVINNQTTPIKQLLKERLILLMPMVNPSGYYSDQREETNSNGNVDINRDFSYDTNQNKKCFQSEGARALANIYKKYRIIAGTTIHGGANVLSWPWGSRNHRKSGLEESTQPPDDTVFKSFADVMYNLSLGNKNMDIPPYTLGYMTNTVYSLNGAYEDWAYAAGWETNSVTHECFNVTNTFYEGLDGKEKTLIYLVEASDQKQPEVNMYGSSEATDYALQQWPPSFYRNISAINDSQILRDGYGHSNRNILLCLGLIDLVQPYIIQDSKGVRIGGCNNVDSLYLYNGSNLVEVIKNIPGIWNDSSYYLPKDKFSQNMKYDIICDTSYLKQNNPDPDVPPQSYYAQDLQMKLLALEQLQQQSILENKSSISNESAISSESGTRTNQTNMTNQNNLQVNKSKSFNHIYLLLGMMIILGGLLSFVFYKYCQGPEEEEQIEMVRSVQHHQEIEPL